MRSRLLWEYREVEGTAPPPQGMGPAAAGTRARGYQCFYPCFSPENPASHPPPSPSTSSSYLSATPRIHSLPPPPPAPHPQPSEAPPLQPPAGALAFTTTNRHLASTTLVPIRAGWRRGFSNIIQAPPGAPRSLLFGESQTGIELSSLPGGSVLLRPRLEGGLAPFPARVLQLSTFCEGTALARGECFVFYPDCMGSLGMAGFW